MSLYEVTAGIDQVRGLGAFHMTFVEGTRGVIVIDPLTSVESAAAALGLYRAQRGDRPITGVIYTHSPGNHLGGLPEAIDPDVPILAPAGFMEHTVSMYTYGATVDIARTGQEETVDGVPFVFQLTPGTQAPAQMNLFLPRRRALCLAGHGSPDSLTETISLFGGQAELLFASHHGPVRGRETILRYLSGQRDGHAYLHDQTVRLLHKGHTGTEIAEMIQLPPELERTWQGSPAQTISQAVAEVYEKHLCGFDGGPVALWQHPPTETAKRYAECFGGVDNLVAKAREFALGGDVPFAAQLLRHAVFAEPERHDLKEFLARVYERLGDGVQAGAANDAWRDFYLAGARELRHGIALTPLGLAIRMAAALPVEQIFHALAIRVDAPQAWHENLAIDWLMPDLAYRTALRHGVLIHHAHPVVEPADLTLTVTKPQLLELLAGQGIEGVAHEGDPGALKRLLSYIDSL